MKLFSERYNYVQSSDSIIRETITPDIQNAICSCYDRLLVVDYKLFKTLERYLWTQFLNQREGNFSRHYIVATRFLEDEKNPWYRKLDLIEESVQYLSQLSRQNNVCLREYREFVHNLNAEFVRLNYAYRIIDDVIVDMEDVRDSLLLEETSSDELPSKKTSFSRFRKLPLLLGSGIHK